jgi:IS30 family transposase
LHLSLADREEVRAGIERGDSLRATSRLLNRSVSTISREVERNGGRDAYRAWRADERAVQASRRPREAKIEANPELRRVIEAKLRKRWSPEQIAQHLRRTYPHDEGMQASSETIYQSLFVADARLTPQGPHRLPEDSQDVPQGARAGGDAGKDHEHDPHPRTTRRGGGSRRAGALGISMSLSSLF